MFCGNCGANNQDGAAFCAGCGAALVSNAQPVDAQPEYASEYVPAAPKKNFIPLIAGIAAVAAVVILLVCLLGGGHGFSEPEDAALAWVEGMCDFDTGDMLQAVYPDIADDIEEDLQDDCDRAEEYYDEADVDLSFSNFETEERDYDYGDDYLDELEEWLSDEYDLDVKVSSVKRIKVSYEVEMDGRSKDTSENVTVVKIDGDWYVLPGEYIDFE